MADLGISGIADAEPIGSGGNATVYRAREVAHDRWVAVKVVRGADESGRRRFDRERKAMGRLSDHDGIVTVYQSGFTDTNEPFLVMPLYEQGSVQTRIDQTGPLDWPTACALMAEVADTVQYANERGVVHRDLKPDNILISPAGRPHVADFGISQFTGASASVGSVALTFTPSFCPPEVIEGAEPSAAADVYGLGATLYALLSGAAPYSTTEGESIFSVIRRIATEPVGDLRQLGVPDGVATVVEQSMAKDPTARIQTAADFAAHLRAQTATPAPVPSHATVTVNPQPATTVAAPLPGSGTGSGVGGRSKGALVAVAALVFALAGLVAAFLATRDSGDGDQVSTGDDGTEIDEDGGDTSTDASDAGADDAGLDDSGGDDGDADGADGSDGTDGTGGDAGDDSEAAAGDGAVPEDTGADEETDDGGDDATATDSADDAGEIPDLSGTTVTIWGVGPERDAVLAGFESFESLTGVTVEYTSVADLRVDIAAALEAGNPPDIAVVFEPSHLSQLAAGGDIVPVPDRVLDVVTANFDAGWFAAATVDGVTYGIPNTGDAKSLVWYSPRVFESNGFEVPQTWDELEALAEQMVSSGIPPWCIGIESGSATGWVLTDWMEDAMLRLHGPITYDRWASHAIPFTAAEVADAAQLVADIWFADDNVLGGRDAIASTSFSDAGLGVTDGSCGMHRQAAFYAGVLAGRGTTAVDYDVFYLPTIDDRFGNPMLVSGTHAVMFDDRPEVAAAIQHFGTVDYADARLASGASGSVSPNRGIDLSIYSSSVSRHAHEILINAGPVRFDASDRMPGVVGSGTFWSEGTEFVVGNQTLEEFLAAVEASWPG